MTIARVMSNQSFVDVMTEVSVSLIAPCQRMIRVKMIKVDLELFENINE